MKKLISIILILVMVLTACSAKQPAESALPTHEAIEAAPMPDAAVPAEQPVSDGTDIEPETIQRISAMQPVMDSILRTMGTESDILFSPRDPDFFWSVLYLTGVNWSESLHAADIDTESSRITIPRRGMQEIASAAFLDYSDLLPLPKGNDYQAVTYDEGLDAYVLMASDAGAAYTMIEHITRAGDNVTVHMGYYIDDGERLGGMVFTLTANPYTDGITDPIFFYSVEKAQTEASLDISPWQEAEPGSDIILEAGSGETAAAKVTVSKDESGSDTVSVVFDTPAGQYTEELGHLYAPSIHVADTLRDDGYTELYITGDMASDDYQTTVFRVNSEGVISAKLWGIVSAVNGSGKLTLDTTIDMLGTYGATCTLGLNSTDKNVLAFDRQSDYSVSSIDAEQSEYNSITVAKDGLPLTQFDDGSITEAEKGHEFIFLQTDMQSYALLISKETGVLYSLAITSETDENDYHTWMIEGQPESEWFEELYYAG